MKKLFILTLSIFLFGCIKEKSDCYTCETLQILSIRNKPTVQPDTTYIYTTHNLTDNECVLMKNISSYTTSYILYNDTINVKYLMRCKIKTY